MPVKRVAVVQTWHAQAGGVQQQTGRRSMSVRQALVAEVLVTGVVKRVAHYRVAYVHQVYAQLVGTSGDGAQANACGLSVCIRNSGGGAGCYLPMCERWFASICTHL